jgi:preprotein translocase subunit SecG
MSTLLLIIHIVVCIALIGIVLLQGGKGAEVGATFGAGASQTIFGAAGSQSFLGKMTTGAAIIFMLTSMALAIFWGQPGTSSIMPEQVAPASAPATMPTPSTPPAAPAGEAK